MHIHLLGRDVHLQRKILAKKQDDMHPPFNTDPGQQFRDHVLLDKNGHLSVRDVYGTAKLRILLKTTAKDGGFFTFTPILLR